MNGPSHLELDDSEFVEVDPTGRYGRYNEVLGKGASKIVYRAFDEYEGIEVAWNQVWLYDFLQSPEDLERLYCEIHLLKTLKHKNIMKFYTSWVDTANRNINFVTEMFTSGTLRQYRLKHKRVNIRAVKHWCRQILRGLLYLHSHDPPVIHRDLKCDNIFINGNQGEVKIGDLGLAAVLRTSYAAHCVGTPEFMAPEVYEEAYNELVDIYSFGMCILEMITFEYPYSECTHPAQIYKKVMSGRKSDALYKVKDPEVRGFIDKCLETVSLRLSARELLNDPFLRVDDGEPDLRLVDYLGEMDDVGPLIRQPYNSYKNGYPNNYYNYVSQNEWSYNPAEMETNGVELFKYQDDDEDDDDDGHSANVDISIKGKRTDNGGLFLRLKIADKEGRVRNICFPFDIETDTALCVATEMVAELDMKGHDVARIANMIDGEIASLVPGWKTSQGIEETLPFANSNTCYNCASNHTSMGSLMDFLSRNTGANVIQCCQNGCASMHGRFEEITFQADEPKHRVTEIWGGQESRELSSMESGQNQSDEENEKSESIFTCDASKSVHHLTGLRSFSRAIIYGDFSEENVKNVERQLRWLKAKYQIELGEVGDQQLGLLAKYLKYRHMMENNTGKVDALEQCSPKRDENKSCNGSIKAGDMIHVKRSYSGTLLPRCLHRTTSLLVDAVDV